MMKKPAPIRKSAAKTVPRRAKAGAKPPSFDQMVTFIYARNPAASHEFYERALRLPLVLDQGGCRIYRVAAEAFLGVCRARPGQTLTVGEGRDKGAVLTLVVKDAAAVEAWGRRLAQAGVQLDTPPRYSPEYDVDHLFARDPDGYWVEVQAFRSKNWPRKGAR
jgi:catechol 2,3-dioxygenase-like lactoylglutathione lyase family enzyme